MNNKVDKFFKEKLETHSLQPSAQAWDKVESHLSKKNKMVVWIRVAAAIALMGALTFVALNWDTNKEQKIEVVKKDEAPREQPVIEQEKIEEKVMGAPKQVAVKKKKATPAAPVVVEEEKVEEPIAIVEEPVIVEAPTKEQKAVNEQKGITLTYSLPSIKKTEPVATEEPVVAEVKKTGLERVLEIAKDVKNADNPLGELREAKDDIFAFDFKKDKDKTKKNY
ncbi:MAG TPA: hypothetical protein VFE50_21870 [Cyclobacteriaceae bacterium]|nr:hypothetical protein [Cyclobacteriaceae bacterium]